MKRVMSGIVALTSAVALSAGAAVAQTPEVEVSGNVSIASDYAFRGISQTLEEPAVQGGFDLGFPYGLYAGAWGSSVNFGESNLAEGPRAQMELDFYGGIAPSVAGFDLDLGGIYYLYPGADVRNYDFYELYGGISRAVGPVGLGVTGAFSPDFFGGSGDGVWLGADASVGVPGTPLTVDGSIGQQTIEDNATWGTPDYMAWSAGLGADILGISVGAMVTGTDLDEDDCFGGSELCNTRVILSVGRGL